MTVATQISEGLAPLVDWVYPPRCPVCGAAIGRQTGLCADCWSTLTIPGEPACATCGGPLAGSAVEAAARCAPCLLRPPRHDGIAAGTIYGDTSRKLVLAYKHGRRIALAPMLARLICARLPPLDGDWLVVPVPLHRWRLWRRGFNQAALLAREVAHARGARLAVDALVRRKATPMLGGLGRNARARALSGALALNPRRAAQVHGANVVLVDDVLTSGATTDACVAVLKRAGAAKVIVACFARVLSEAEIGSAVPGYQNETPEAEAPGAA